MEQNTPALDCLYLEKEKFDVFKIYSGNLYIKLDLLSNIVL